MIEFVSLFLGLVVGTLPVEVQVDDSVASVEILLDGTSVGILQSVPWKLDCELGQELAPHRLVAVARDGVGRELMRTEQLLNLPRKRAEARWTLDWTPGASTATAGLIWEALDAGTPREVAVSLDGEPLEISDPQRIELPPFDPDAAHLLHAELDFSDTVHAEAELVFGGRFSDQISTELTALPVVGSDLGRPRPEEMRGWFLHDGEPLEVAAAARLPADLVVVRESAKRNHAGLKTLAMMRRGKPGATVDVPYGLAARDWLRFVFPIAIVRKQGGVTYHLMESTGNMARMGSLFETLTATFFKEKEEPSPAQLLAEAVATAALKASRTGRPRAVLLIRSGESEDVSRFSVEAVRNYLRSVRVPLVVWTPNARAARQPSPWGDSVAVTSVQRMAESIGELREVLDSQVVVWLRGHHLPHEIELSDDAEVRLPG